MAVEPPPVALQEVLTVNIDPLSSLLSAAVDDAATVAAQVDETDEVDEDDAAMAADAV